MNRIVIVEDKSTVPGTRNYLHEGIDSSILVEFNYHNSDNHKLDLDLHNFLSEKIIPLKPDIILLPCSVGEYHTEYLGIRLGMHLRLTRSFKTLRFIPIVFFSPDKLQDILTFNKLAIIISTPRCYLTRDLLSEIQSLLKLNLSALTKEEYSLFLTAIHMDPPENYFSVHSVANEWGAYRLDRIAGTEVLNRHDFPGMYSLFFKWLDARSTGILDIEDESENENDEDVFINFQIMRDVTPVILDVDKKAILEKNLGSDSKKRFK